MTATVRSVRVVMEADVASYERKMRSAGHTTEQAFDRVGSKMTATNRGLATVETSMNRVQAVETKVAASTARMNTEFGRTDQVVKRSANQLDSFSGRANLVAQALATIGPAAVPIGALAIPALVGLAAQGGVTAAALGSTVLAFQGVGDALDALAAYRTDRSAENLAELRTQMAGLGPDARVLTRQLFELRDETRALRDTAAAGVLPGVSEALGDLETKLPKVQAVLAAISTQTGDIVADAGGAVADGKLDNFLDYLGTDGRVILDDTAAAVGSLGHAIAETFVATAPLQRDFTGWLRDVAADLDAAASGLGDSQGLRDFIDYVRTTGPQVADTLGAVANAVVQIVQAAAPLGGPVLQVLETTADALATVADSNIGTPILVGLAALSLYNRGLAVTQKLSAAAAADTRTLGSTVAGSVQTQVDGIRSLPAAYREAAKAQQALTVAQTDQRKAASTYVGQLQAQNRLTAQGYTVSREAQDRLGDSLGRVEMASYSVQTATERAAAAEKQRGRVLRATAADAGKAGLAVGGLALATSGLAEDTGYANTASLALLGTIAGGYGAAAGAGIGYILDLKGAYDSLGDSIAELQALSGSTNTGLLEQQIAAKQKDLDALKSGEGFSFTEDVLGFDPDFVIDKTGQASGKTAELAAELASLRERLAGLQDGSVATLNPVMSLADALTTAANSAQKEAQALDAAVESMRAKRSEALRALSAELDYKAAILDARDALKENGRTVNENTRAGQDNLRTLYAIAAAWNEQTDAQKNASGGLKAARANFVDTATAMGLAEDKATRLAQRLFEIKPRDVAVTVNGIDNAANRAQGLKAILDSLKSKDINIALHYQTIGNKPPAPTPGNPDGIADGGTVGGQRQPYGDKVFAHLAPGEEVISNRHGQADRYRADRDAGRIPGYADGGTIRRVPRIDAAAGYVARVNTSPVPTRRTPSGGDDTLTVDDLADQLGQTAAAAITATQGLKALTAEMKQLEQQTKRLERQSAKAEKAAQDELAARDAVQSSFDQIAATATGLLTSDIFAVSESPTNPWAPGARAGGTMDPFGVLQSDIDQAGLYRELVEQLKVRGLGDGALTEAAGKGIPALQLLADYSDQQLSQFGALYDQRAGAVAGAAGGAASAVLGDELATANTSLTQALRHYDRMEDRLKDVEKATRAVESAIDKAEQSNRQGQRDNARDTGAEVKSAAGKGQRDRVYGGGTGGRRHR